MPAPVVLPILALIGAAGAAVLESMRQAGIFDFDFSFAKGDEPFWDALSRIVVGYEQTVNPANSAGTIRETDNMEISRYGIARADISDRPIQGQGNRPSLLCLGVLTRM